MSESPRQVPGRPYASIQTACAGLPHLTRCGGWGLAGSSLERLEAVRVHQAEGLVAIAPVHTVEMPNAMAWLDDQGRLTFGSLDLTTQLRWHTHGMLFVCLMMLLACPLGYL